MAKKKELPKKKEKEEVMRFLPQTSPRGQPIGNKRFKTLSSKVKPVWNGNNL